jgi:hypothetical protein
MTNTQTLNKPLTIEKAIHELNSITQRLIYYEQSFNVRHKQGDKEIMITAVANCDSVKVVCPQFQIKFDERQARYAELVLNYE